jgi:hypothetical protein
MQSTHSFSYNNYGVTLTTFNNNITFNMYDRYKCIHTGVLTDVDATIQHKINCAIAYKKYVVRAKEATICPLMRTGKLPLNPKVPDSAPLNPPNITFDLYDGTVLTVECK